MPRFRFSLRWMMVVVVIFAMGFGFEVMRRRRVQYLALAKEHALWEGVWNKSADDMLDKAGWTREQLGRVRIYKDRERAREHTPPGLRIFAPAVMMLIDREGVISMLRADLAS